MKKDLDILTLGIAEAWNMYKVLSKRDTIYKQIRFGVHIKFDINDYLKGRILTKPKKGDALIRGSSVSLEEFETELEDREKLIKEWLNDNYCDEELITPRGQA